MGGVGGTPVDLAQTMNYVGNEMRKRYSREEERVEAMGRWRGWVRGRQMGGGEGGGEGGLDVGGGGEEGGGGGGGIIMWAVSEMRKRYSG